MTAPELPPSASTTDEEGPRHAKLRSHPLLWSTIGILQTILTAGVVFGWASLLPCLREEGIQCSSCSTQDFSIVFTAGAIGNYMSTLFFGRILDVYGPRVTAIVASVLFGMGLVFCSIGESGSTNLSVGFGLLGFAGPGVQMPTLHLANLFPGAALYMSSQAAAFDGGTFVFALGRSLFHLGVSTAAFFRCYLVIPLVVFVTAVSVWPDSVLGSYSGLPPKEEDVVMSPYIGTASSPALSIRSVRSSFKSMRSLNELMEQQSKNSLVDAPLKKVLSHPSFWTLASWTAIHILKLNFIVASLNDQLSSQSLEASEINNLIGVFGTMLPFGFVVMPIIAKLLSTNTIYAFQVTNIIGVAYGAIMLWCPTNNWLLMFVVFPAVATSRQMVYSTVFHQIGEMFGFANYGTLLGLANVIVSAFSMVQTWLVGLSEENGSYYVANMVLLMLTFTLFFVGFGLQSKGEKKGKVKKLSAPSEAEPNEDTPFLRKFSNLSMG